ncbi:MAG TPA: universal stress protein [Chthoniobacteraceae bacterium]|jgi:nucleotide-binding universal stress UspA family protein
MKTILVPVDFSDVTTAVLSAAQTLAQAFGSKIILLHVSEPEPDFVGFEPGPQTVRMSVARDLHAEHRQLEELKQTLLVDSLALHIQGPMAEKILLQAAEHSADLIVMGSHGHGALYELLVGSVTSSVLKSAACPVLVVPARRS